MPLSKNPKDTSKDIRELYKANKDRAAKGEKPRSQAQIIAIALSATGKGRKK